MSQLALAGPGRRRRKTTAVPAINSSRRTPPTRMRGQTAGAAAIAGRAGAGLALEPPAALPADLPLAAATGALLGRPREIRCWRRSSDAWYQPPLVFWSNTGWPGLV